MNDHVRQRPRIDGHGTIAPDLAHQAQDDAFHEIQLNGKQLVFLFMAATVVSVVIFLCGVLVGRGVRAERGIADAQVASAAEATPQPAAAPPTPPPAGSDPTTAAAPPAAEDLSYFTRLEKSKAPAEQLKSADAQRQPAPAADRDKDKGAKEPAAHAAAPAAAAAAAPPAPPPPKPAPAKEKEAARKASDAAPAAGEPSGQGFAVQIAALNVRSEADAIVRRLSSK